MTFAIALRTGIGDLPVDRAKSAYKPAYKKLAKKAYSGLDKSATIVTDPDSTAGGVHNEGVASKPMNNRVLCAESNELSLSDNTRKRSGPGWIRTSVGSRQRVYSPFPLAARAPTHN